MATCGRCSTILMQAPEAVFNFLCQARRVLESARHAAPSPHLLYLLQPVSTSVASASLLSKVLCVYRRTLALRLANVCRIYVKVAVELREYEAAKLLFKVNTCRTRVTAAWVPPALSLPAVFPGEINHRSPSEDAELAAVFGVELRDTTLGALDAYDVIIKLLAMPAAEMLADQQFHSAGSCGDSGAQDHSDDVISTVVLHALSKALIRNRLRN
jgi:hypothetical protein